MSEKEIYLVKAIQCAAEKDIPKTTGKKTHKETGFYNARVKRAISMVNVHLDIYKQNPNQENKALLRKSSIGREMSHLKQRMMPGLISVKALMSRHLSPSYGLKSELLQGRAELDLLHFPIHKAKRKT